ncbi:MAG: glycosyltransferase family 9 protein [Acidobacteria bacterium]|nr:glycosyltransferase family 9 protein [Acidobacteriota bacterium]
MLRLRSLGDTLLTTPALRALKAWRPDLKLAALVDRRSSDVLAGNPDVSERIEFDGARRLGEVVARVRGEKFALAVNVHGGTLSALLTLGSGACYRAGRTHFRFRFAYNLLCPEPPAVVGRREIHTVEDRLSTFYWLGVPQGEVPGLQVFPQESARDAVHKKLAAHGVHAGTRYGVLHPTATFFTKEWPLARFLELAGWLQREQGLVPVLSCGPGEARRIRRALAGRAVACLGETSVGELIALIEGAALYVGNDSGPTHIAAALGRPLVVLFGSSNSVAWRPWQTAHELVQNYYPCNPCPGDRCYVFDEPKCILSITLEQVQAAVERTLARMPVPANLPSVGAKRV